MWIVTAAINPLHEDAKYRRQAKIVYFKKKNQKSKFNFLLLMLYFDSGWQMHSYEYKKA